MGTDENEERHALFDFSARAILVSHESYPHGEHRDSHV